MRALRYFVVNFSLDSARYYIVHPCSWEAAPIIHWFRGRCFQEGLEASRRRETIKSRFYAWSASGRAWLVYLNLGTETVYTLIRSIFILPVYDFLITSHFDNGKLMISFNIYRSPSRIYTFKLHTSNFASINKYFFFKFLSTNWHTRTFFIY